MLSVHPPSAPPQKAIKVAKAKQAGEPKRKGRKRVSVVLEEARGEGEDVTMVGTEDAEEVRKEAQAEGQEKSAGGEKGKGKWGWTSIIDPETASQPAVFSKDGRFFFLPTASAINVHSTATGQVLSSLVPPLPPSSTPDEDPKSQITSLALNPSNQFQIISGSLDGRVIVWDYLDGVPLRIVHMRKPVTHLCVHDTLKDQVLVAANEVSKKKLGHDGNPVIRTRIYRVRLSTQSKQPVSTTPLASFMAISASGTHVVVTSGFSCYVHTLSADGQANSVKYSSMDRITCLAFHPEEEWFATGDTAGVIRYWYCVAENTGAAGGQLPMTSHAWHAHPVQALAFTPNGAYLLSGGEEAVVVVWQIHTGRKEFVPRVGGPIRWLSIKPAQPGSSSSSSSSSEEEWLAGLSDRTFVWLSSGALKIGRTIARVKLDLSSLPAPLPASLPLAYHSPSASLILPSSHPSFLQIYAHASRTLLSELEVHPSNRVSRQNPDDAPLPAVRVEHVALSAGGEWMATVDCRRGGQDLDRDVDRDGAVITLKVWRWDARGKEWALNTRVERPHGAREVVGVVFQPLPAVGGRERACVLATAGRDGNVKTWAVRVVGEGKGGESLSWIPRSSFSYRTHPPSSLLFSPDASLLAVAHGPSITLWDPHTNLLRRVLTTAAYVRVERMAFVGQHGRWLAVLERRPEGEYVGGEKVVLVLWDLLSCSTAWEYNLGSCTAHLVPHPKEPAFVIFASTPSTPSTPSAPTPSRALIFTSSSPLPLRTQHLPFSLHDVLWYPSSRPTLRDEFEFVGITDELDIVLFGDAVRAQVPAGAQQLGAVALPRARTLFQDVFGSSAVVDLAAAGVPPPIRAAEQSKGTIENSVFAAPAYLLPPMSTLFASFMEGIIEHRPPTPPPDIPALAEGKAKEQRVEKSGGRMDVDLPKRVVDEAEVELLVQMFKAQMSPGPAEQLRTTNGAPKGAAAAHTNGSSPAKSVPVAVGESAVEESGKRKRRKSSTGAVHS